MEMQGTLDSSVESRPKVCRLCFSVNISFSELSSDLRDVIQIILPNVDLEKCTTDSVLCEECDKIVQELFAFKSMCCEIEDTIHNYTNGGQIQVDLEKITGVVQLDIMYDEEGRRWKICRTCLDLTDPSSTLEISKSENRDLCADLTAYLPEVDISLTMSPVICLNCTKLVRTYATYSTKCMANETELTSYFEKLPPEAHTDLYSLLQKCKEGFPSKINLKKENSGSNHKDAMPNLDSESSRTTDVLAAPHANSDSEGDADDPMPELDPAVDSDSGHSYSNVRISTKAGPRNSKIAIEEISMSDVSVFEQTSKSNVNDVGSASSNNSGNNSDAPVSEQASKSDGSNDGSGSSSSVSRNYSETGLKDDAMLSSNNLNDTPYNTRKRKYKKIVDDDKDVFEDDTGKDPDFIMDELDEMDYDPDNFEDDDDEDSDQTYMPSENSKSRKKLLRRLAPQSQATYVDCKYCGCKSINSKNLDRHLGICNKNPIVRFNRKVFCKHCCKEGKDALSLEGHLSKCQRYLDSVQPRAPKPEKKEKKPDMADLSKSPSPSTVHRKYVRPDKEANLKKLKSDLVSYLSKKGNQEDHPKITAIVQPQPVMTASQSVPPSMPLQVNSQSANQTIQMQNAMEPNPMVTNDGCLQLFSPPQQVLRQNSPQAMCYGMDATSGAVFVFKRNIRQPRHLLPVKPQPAIANGDQKPESDAVVSSGGAAAENPVLEAAPETVGTTGDSAPVPAAEGSVTPSDSTVGAEALPVDQVSCKIESLFAGIEDSNAATPDPGQPSVDQSVPPVEPNVPEAPPGNPNIKVISSVVVKTAPPEDKTPEPIKALTVMIDLSSEDEERPAEPKAMTRLDSNPHISSQFLAVLKCDNCSFNTRRVAKVEEHLLTHLIPQSGSFICQFCFTPFEDARNFYHHVKTAHSKLGYKMFYWCVNCTNVFKDLDEVCKHECLAENKSIKLFKSNGVIFCMLCTFESENYVFSREHSKFCVKRRYVTQNAAPEEVIELD